MDALHSLSTVGTGGAILGFFRYRRWLWRLRLAQRFVVFVVLVLLPGLAVAALLASATNGH